MFQTGFFCDHGQLFKCQARHRLLLVSLTKISLVEAAHFRFTDSDHKDRY